MKLTKLLLLVPAFAMIACSKNAPVQPSSEEDKSQITEAEFTAIFQDLRLFHEENVFFRAEIVGKGAMITEAENGVTKFYDEPYVENTEKYIEFEKDYFSVIEYDEGYWYASQYDADEASSYYFDNTAFIPFSFKDFARDEATKSYKAETAIVEDDGHEYTFNNVEIKFENAKPTSITFTYLYNGNPEDTIDFVETFVYGSAHVVNPK